MTKMHSLDGTLINQAFHRFNKVQGTEKFDIQVRAFKVWFRLVECRFETATRLSGKTNFLNAPDSMDFFKVATLDLFSEVRRLPTTLSTYLPRISLIRALNSMGLFLEALELRRTLYPLLLGQDNNSFFLKKEGVKCSLLSNDTSKAFELMRQLEWLDNSHSRDKTQIFKTALHGMHSHRLKDSLNSESFRTQVRQSRVLVLGPAPGFEAEMYREDQLTAVPISRHMLSSPNLHNRDLSRILAYPDGAFFRKPLDEVEQSVLFRFGTVCHTGPTAPRKFKSRLRVASNGNSLAVVGGYNRVQRILHDLVALDVGDIKLSHVDFFTTAETYSSSYSQIGSNADLNPAQFGAHDPVDNFLFVKSVQHHLELKAHGVSKMLLNQTVDNYLGILSKRLGCS